jgi:cyanosortase A-associated protein
MTSDPKIGKIVSFIMIFVAIVAWTRLPLVVGKHGDFPYPDLAPALQASAPELTPNSDPYAESSWGRVARYRIPQGELSLSFRPSGDFTAIRTIFRNLADNTPTEWETVSVPEGSVAWRLQEGKLKLATLIHPNGKLTTSEEEFGQAIQKVRLDPSNLAKWFIGQAKLRERRVVLVHLQVAGAEADQVQSFVPVVAQAARLTVSQF